MPTVKKQLFEQLALIGQVLSSPQRIELIDYLAQAERNVEELSQLSGLSVANTSRHLQQLKHAGLVTTRKQGKSRFYQLAGADVVSLVKQLRQTADSHLAEVDRLMTTLMPQKNKTEIITSEALAHEMQKNHFIVLDVRPTKEFNQGHIKGALNVIPEKIDETIETLPKDKTIVAYCRGPYCLYSYQMVEHLRENGRDALRLDEGFPEWKAAGLPYETTLSH